MRRNSKIRSSNRYNSDNNGIEENLNLRRTNSASNLSSVSCNSASLARRTLCLTLPRDFGCDLSENGKVTRLYSGSPAHASGVIQVGDYITVFENEEYHFERCNYSRRSGNCRRNPLEVCLHVTYGVLLVDDRPTCPLMVEIRNG